MSAQNVKPVKNVTMPPSGPAAQRAPVRPPAARREYASPEYSSMVARIPLPPAGCARDPLLARLRGEQAIRHAAYFRWAYRGCAAGGELADWVAAEREVDEQLAEREALIQEAAYARWLKRGRGHGQDTEDWLAAEQEVDAALTRRGVLCAH